MMTIQKTFDGSLHYFKNFPLRLNTVNIDLGLNHWITWDTLFL